MYFLLTVFHAVIYFSMHVVKHFSSLDDNELPGDGMHLSKQWLFIFWEQMAIRYMGEIDTGESRMEILRISMTVRCSRRPLAGLVSRVQFWGLRRH